MARKRLPSIFGATTGVATTVTQGTVKITPTPASPSDPVALGSNSTQLPPTPSGVGKTIYDNGSAYVALANGTTDQYLGANTGAAPSWKTLVVPSSTPGFRNLLINGNGAINQRFASTNVSANGYGPDRWRMTLGTGAAATLGRSSYIGSISGTDTFHLGKYYMSFSRTTAGSSASVIEQRIEGVRNLAGSTATLSFLAKSGDSATPTIVLHQNFGTGGSPSATVDTTIATSIALTSTFTLYTYTFSVPGITGKTPGNNLDDYLSLEFQISSAQAGTRTIDLFNVQLELGSTATIFEIRPPQVEIALCQRYHCKSFNIDTAEAQNAGLTGSVQACAVSTTNGSLSHMVQYPVEMRAAPTVTTYNTSAAAATWFNATASIAATTANIGTREFTLTANAAPTAARIYNIHWSADAEL